MLEKKLAYGILTTLLALNLIVGFIIYSLHQSKSLSVIFLDVGQGDAILISSGINQILIDGGRNSKIALEKLGKYIPFWDRQLEVIVATHPDQDHIGGLVGVLETYQVVNFIKTKAESDSQAFQVLKDKINKENLEEIEAIKNLTIRFPDEGEISFLYPFSTVTGSAQSI